MAYTVPSILLREDRKVTYVMDSRAIANILETHYPTPSLHLSTEDVMRVEQLVTQIAALSRPLWVHVMANNVLRESSAKFYVETRPARFGRSLEEKNKRNGGENVWKELGEKCKTIGDILRNSHGSFVLDKMSKLPSL